MPLCLILVITKCPIRKVKISKGKTFHVTPPHTRVEAEKESIAEIVPQMVKDTLGIKDGKAKVEGGVIDSNTDTPYVAQRDYTEFLE